MRPWTRYILIIAGVLIVLLLIGLAFLIPNWPYSERVLLPALRETFKADVAVKTFRRFYFPHPGCAAEFVTLTRPGKASPIAPLVTVQKIVVAGRYSDFLFRPHHFDHIKLDGLYVRIPPRHESEPLTPQATDDASKISVGSVTSNGAVLEFASHDGHDPLKFEIHYLRVESIAAGKAMSYLLRMGNPEPPAELESRGSFGPWQKGHIGNIPLNGSIKLADAQLDKYDGFGGTLESEEQFSGTLDNIDIQGQVTSANFLLKKANHPVALTSQFHLIVNGLNGDVQLQEVTAQIARTTAKFQGKIAKNPETHRRETLLDIAIEHGRAEDLLWFFNEEPQAAMVGPATFSGRARVPKFGSDFLETLEISGKFQVADAHFQKKTQRSTNELSARALGKKIKDPADAPEVLVETLAGDCAMQKGVAHFPNLDFRIPGAQARMHGTYNFLKHTVDLHGDLRTQASISQDSTGIKSILLKPLDPLFRKKHAGAQIPVLMDGPIQKPRFATDILHK